MSKPKLDIFKMLRGIDQKDYSFYDNLDEEERKGFSGYLGLKWAASVEGSPELQHYYLASTNYYANRNFFDINKHPKLQWLTLVASSPGLGTQKHKWFAMKKKDSKGNDVKKQLSEMYPTYKDEDIELLSKFVTKKELKEYAKSCGEGWDAPV